MHLESCCLLKGCWNASSQMHHQRNADQTLQAICMFHAGNIIHPNGIHHLALTHILTMPSFDSRMFSGFRSLCKMPDW